MKLFDIDWQDFIQRLAVWQKLSVVARRTFAELQSNHSVPVLALDGHEKLLADADFIEIHGARSHVRLAKPCYPFARAIRAMLRHDLLAQPDDESLQSYLRDHFTGEELARMGSGLSQGYYGVEHSLVPEVRSVGWVERFLAEPGKKQSGRLDRMPMPTWLKMPNMPRSASQPPVDPEVAKRLVRHLMDLPEAVPFAELPGRWADIPTASLGVAIAQGVERAILFPAMRREDMTPMLGLWPTISYRLHRPKATSPKPVKPQTVFHGAMLLEDMTTALVATVGQPLRLRGNDGSLFAKAQRDLQANLMSVPEWVLTLLKRSPEGRISAAMEWLEVFGLAKRAGVPGDDLRLQATPKGQAWLAETAGERLKVLLDHLRADKKKTLVPIHSFGPDDDDDLDDEIYDPYSSQIEFLPFRVQTSGIASHEKELRLAIVSAMKTVPGDSFLPLAEFLEWHAREANPLPSLYSTKGRPSLYLHWSSRAATIEEMEEVWGGFLITTLYERLVPLGGARLGVIDEVGRVGFALTDVGRYLLGLAKDFDYGHDQDSQGTLVVQPNFDIVFLAPSPLAEAALVRFAERKGRGVGTLFSITKKSIVAAAGSGMKAAQVLESLERLSAKQVPANVAREITGWFDQCRRITVRPALLIHCPDAATAARVVAASGKKAVALTDTVVELTNARAKTELLRKLYGLGIFIEDKASSKKDREKKPRATRGRRRRSW